MEEKEITTRSAEETEARAGRFISEILLRKDDKAAERQSGRAIVLCLRGDLGSGKTTFTKGLGKALGIKDVLSSPTFLIMKKYPLPEKYGIRHLYHFDAYRISGAQEIIDLGWEEIISGRHNIVVVEWPEKISSILPGRKINIDFRHISENERRIIFSFN